MGRLVEPVPDDYKEPAWQGMLISGIVLVLVGILIYGIWKGW